MFKIEMQTESVAFGDTREEQANEVARILRDIADELTADVRARSGSHQNIVDINGNDAGRYLLKPSNKILQDEAMWLRRRQGP
jgi:hypothetical protein